MKRPNLDNGCVEWHYDEMEHTVNGQAFDDCHFVPIVFCGGVVIYKTVDSAHATLRIFDGVKDKLFRKECDVRFDGRYLSCDEKIYETYPQLSLESVVDEKMGEEWKMSCINDKDLKFKKVKIGNMNLIGKMLCRLTDDSEIYRIDNKISDTTQFKRLHFGDKKMFAVGKLKKRTMEQNDENIIYTLIPHNTLCVRDLWTCDTWYYSLW